MYYSISTSLLTETKVGCLDSDLKYVAVVTPEQWREDYDEFEMGIDLDMGIDRLHSTKAEENYDSLTGAFSLPDRYNMDAPDFRFAFALDERGIVFIDSTGKADELCENLRVQKHWRRPSLGRFVYEFLQLIITDDFDLIHMYEMDLGKIEEQILSGDRNPHVNQVNKIRRYLLKLRTHYEQMYDFSEILEENENDFIEAEDLRYFGIFMNHITRLQDQVSRMIDFATQVRDLYEQQLDIKQNRAVTFLTIVTTIFAPLTLITGWYGMNFKYMPELEYQMSYPIVIIFSIAIAIGLLAYFRYKRWL